MDLKTSLIHFLKSEILEDNSIELNNNDELLSDGTINSLGLMRMIRFIEQQVEIEIPFEDINPDNFMTIKSILDYIDKKRK